MKQKKWPEHDILALALEQQLNPNPKIAVGDILKNINSGTPVKVLEIDLIKVQDGKEGYIDALSKYTKLVDAESVSNNPEIALADILLQDTGKPVKVVEVDLVKVQDGKEIYLANTNDYVKMIPIKSKNNA